MCVSYVIVLFSFKLFSSLLLLFYIFKTFFACLCASLGAQCGRQHSFQWLFDCLYVAFPVLFCVFRFNCKEPFNCCCSAQHWGCECCEYVFIEDKNVSFVISDLKSYRINRFSSCFWFRALSLSRNDRAHACCLCIYGLKRHKHQAIPIIFYLFIIWLLIFNVAATFRSVLNGLCVLFNGLTEFFAGRIAQDFIEPVDSSTNDTQHKTKPNQIKQKHNQLSQPEPPFIWWKWIGDLIFYGLMWRVLFSSVFSWFGWCTPSKSFAFVWLGIFRLIVRMLS